MIVYHYSDEKFDNFDSSKSDGFWFTDIEPSDEELLEEIGAQGMRYVAICEINFSNPLVNGSNFDVAEQLEESGCDAIENLYDGFSDYALIDNSLITIKEWVSI